MAMPHVSDEEDDGKPFGGSALREQKAISFSLNVTSAHRPHCISYEFTSKTVKYHRVALNVTAEK